MAEENSVQSSLNSAFKTAAQVGKFALKKGVDAGLTLASGGTSKALQFGAKAVKGLQKASQITGAVGKQKEDKTWLWVLIGIVGFFILIIICIIVIPAAFITESLEKVKIPFAVSSEYIAASKVVSPADIENSQLPYTFEYTITITAIKENLSDVEFIDSFTVYQNSISKSFNPGKFDFDGIEPGSNKIGEIKVGEPKIFSYKITLDNTYKDSLILNDIIVKAKVSGLPKQVKANASITIGSPTGCFTFTGPWTDEEKTKELAAIAKIFFSPKFAGDLCKNPIKPITLIRQKGNDWCRAPQGGSEIYITDKCLRTEENTLRSLAHEAGHIYASRNSQTYANFITSIISFSGGQQLEDFLCSYPLTKSIDEDFPETISVYITNQFYPGYSFPACGPIDLQQDYPRHYNFIKYLF